MGGLLWSSWNSPVWTRHTWLLNSSHFIDLSGCCFGLEGPFFEDISLPTWIPKGLLFWKSFGLRWAFLFPPWPPHYLDWLSQACHPSFSLFLPSGLLKYYLFTKEASYFYPSIHLINCSFGDTSNRVKHWAGQASSRISAPYISEDSPFESHYFSLLSHRSAGHKHNGLGKSC